MPMKPGATVAGEHSAGTATRSPANLVAEGFRRKVGNYAPKRIAAFARVVPVLVSGNGHG